MRFRLIFFTLLLCVLGISRGYKLRRDIGKVRQYCKEICKQCGGEAALTQDVCVCNIEEEVTTGINHCLQRAHDKFGYLGIKWEENRSRINKRSIYKSNFPSGENEKEIFHDGGEETRKELVKSSLTLRKNIRHSHQVEPNKKTSSNEVVAPSAVILKRVPRSLHDYRESFDRNGLAEDELPPVIKYPLRPEADFKLLLGRPKDGLQRQSYYKIIANEGEYLDNQIFLDDMTGSDEINDYSEDLNDCADEIDFRRFEYLPNKPHKPATVSPLPSPISSLPNNGNLNPGNNERDWTSVLESILPQLYSSYFHYPSLHIMEY